MTTERAIAILQDDDEALVTLFELNEAVDMAIEALKERPHGEWIDFQEDGYVECPFCGSMTECDGNKDELHYCFSCGAELS